MQLTLSHASGPTEPPLRDLSLGELLAWAAETTPERVALIAGVPDPAARSAACAPTTWARSRSAR